MRLTADGYHRTLGSFGTSPNLGSLKRRGQLWNSHWTERDRRRWHPGPQELPIIILLGSNLDRFGVGIKFFPLSLSEDKGRIAMEPLVRSGGWYNPPA